MQPAVSPVRVCLCLPPLLHAGLSSLLAGRTEVVVVELGASPGPQVVLGETELLRRQAASGLLPDGVPRVALARHCSERLPSPGDPLAAYRSGGVTCLLPPDVVVDDVVRVVCETARRPAPSEPRTESLSPREVDVVQAICRGRSNAEIAGTLHLSPNSVKTYVRTAYRKMGVTTRSQAVRWGIEHGLV